eukprot:6199194-Pleurochrysis_carterae.AAC.1
MHISSVTKTKQTSFAGFLSRETHSQKHRACEQYTSPKQREARLAESRSSCARVIACIHEVESAERTSNVMSQPLPNAPAVEKMRARQLARCAQLRASFED